MLKYLELTLKILKLLSAIYLNLYVQTIIILTCSQCKKSTLSLLLSLKYHLYFIDTIHLNSD